MDQHYINNFKSLIFRARKYHSKDGPACRWVVGVGDIARKEDGGGDEKKLHRWKSSLAADCNG
ncbi:hypothetical protein GmHk_09G025096 [Glycine max]|nr:hypothetical protein GmHk_09G025096 [Glycine max]